MPLGEAGRDPVNNAPPNSGSVTCFESQALIIMIAYAHAESLNIFNEDALCLSKVEERLREHWVRASKLQTTSVSGGDLSALYSESLCCIVLLINTLNHWMWMLSGGSCLFRRPYAEVCSHRGPCRWFQVRRRWLCAYLIDWLTDCVYWHIDLVDEY